MIPRQPDGRAELVPSATLAAMPWLDLVMWCYATARYGLVTSELVDWLRPLLVGRKAIEVGAGQGDLGFHLGIHQTDSAAQVLADAGLLKLAYIAMGQTPTDPPIDVERVDAATAVAKHRPHVVVASWLTQKYQAGDERPPRVGSSVYGVNECDLIDSVETYIHIGNASVHGDKRALQLPHKVFEFPWLWSRSKNPTLNRIWIWGKM